MLNQSNPWKKKSKYFWVQGQEKCFAWPGFCDIHHSIVKHVFVWKIEMRKKNKNLATILFALELHGGGGVGKLNI